MTCIHKDASLTPSDANPKLYECKKERNRDIKFMNRFCSCLQSPEWELHESGVATSRDLKLSWRCC